MYIPELEEDDVTEFNNDSLVSFLNQREKGTLKALDKTKEYINRIMLDRFNRRNFTIDNSNKMYITASIKIADLMRDMPSDSSLLGKILYFMGNDLGKEIASEKGFNDVYIEIKPTPKSFEQRETIDFTITITPNMEEVAS